MSRIKKSDMIKMYKDLDEVQDFLICFLDFTDDKEQDEYIHNLIDRLEKSMLKIKSTVEP